MQPESKISAELYEKNFGAAGRRRGLIIMAVAVIVMILVVVGFTRSMSYVGSMNAQVYDVFDAKSDKLQKEQPAP